uniref:Uncharacterized protein n=1 Tax=Heliothis virescens TaxID=7102 RepID=A0A2A4J6X5_HELVI
MGKRTRSNSDDYAEIARKVKKLNQKLLRARHQHIDRRRNLSSSSSGSDSSPSSSSSSASSASPPPRSRARHSSPPIQEPLSIEDVPRFGIEEGVPVASTSAAAAVADAETGPAAAVAVDTLSASGAGCLPIEPGTELELDEDILKILGDDPSQQRLYGKDIQSDLAIRLQHVATSGLNKEARKELTDKYLLPGNCTLLDAPALNPEIKAAVTEAVFKRDKAIELRQKQLSSVASCLGEAISKLMTQPVKDTELIQMLMDGSKLLCDAQHADSLTRRNFILNNLKKELKDQLAATKIDKLLFSEELSNTLKTAKAISQSSADMKQTIKNPIKRPLKPMKNLNWRAPPPNQARPRGSQRMKEPVRNRQENSSKRSSNPASTRSRRR